MFVEAIFGSSFCFSFILFVTAFSLSHVNKVFRVAGNVVSTWFCFACGMECVRSKRIGYVVARRTAAAALKRA